VSDREEIVEQLFYAILARVRLSNPATKADPPPTLVSGVRV